jgi:hypothetical protein
MLPRELGLGQRRRTEQRMEQLEQQGPQREEPQLQWAGKARQQQEQRALAPEPQREQFREQLLSSERRLTLVPLQKRLQARWWLG